MMTKWCKWYCFSSDIEKQKKTCNKPECLNKARADLLNNLDKKKESYKKLLEIEKELY